MSAKTLREVVAEWRNDERTLAIHRQHDHIAIRAAQHLCADDVAPILAALEKLVAQWKPRSCDLMEYDGDNYGDYETAAANRAFKVCSAALESIIGREAPHGGNLLLDSSVVEDLKDAIRSAKAEPSPGEGLVTERMVHDAFMRSGINPVPPRSESSGVAANINASLTPRVDALIERALKLAAQYQENMSQWDSMMAWEQGQYPKPIPPTVADVRKGG